MRVFLYLGIALLPATISAQAPGTVSASEMQEIISYRIPDTGTIMGRLRKGAGILNTHPDSAASIFRHVSRQSYISNFPKGLALASYYSGKYYEHKRAFGKTAAMYRQALGYYRSVPPEERNAELIVDMNNRVAVYYYSLGMYDSGALYLYHALAGIRQNKVRPSYIAGVYANLGNFWQRVGEPENALYFLSIGETVARYHKDSASLALILTNKCFVYTGSKEWDKAIRYGQQALTLARRFGNYAALWPAAANLARVYAEKEDFGKAVRYAEEAVAAGKSADSAFNYNNITSSYVLGYIYYRTGNYRKAKEILIPALSRAHETSTRDQMIDVYEMLAEIYAHEGKHTAAYDYQRTYSSLYRDMMSKDKLAGINRLQVKYRTAEKDKELAQNQLLINKQQTRIRERNLMIIFSGAGSVLLIVFLIGSYRSYRNKQGIQAEKIRNLLQQQALLGQEKEIDHLRSLMQGEEKERARLARELHDGIVSELSAVKMNFSTVPLEVPETGNSENFNRALTQLEHTIGELRKTAHNLLPEILIRTGLAEAVSIHCSKVSQAGNLRIECQFIGTMPRLEDDFELSLYRIVQELVQNITKHAQATRAIVQFNCQDSYLTVTIEDNGNGIIPGQSDKQENSLGLHNLRDRLSTMKGEMEISGGPGRGTTVHIGFDISAVIKTSSHAHQSSYNG